MTFIISRKIVENVNESERAVAQEKNRKECVYAREVFHEFVEFSGR